MKILILLTTGLLLAVTSVFAQEGFEDVEYNDEGRFAVQVEAWRSEVKAQNRVLFWKDQGFAHATFAREGNESTGNIWFRVYLGRFANFADAREFKAIFTDRYDHEIWITTTHSERMTIAGL